MSLWRISRQVWGRFRQQTPLRRLGWQLGRVAPWSPARNSAHCQSVNREICFSIKTYGSNFIKQHSETVMVWNYQNADCSLRKKLFVSFIIILGTLSFLIIFRQLATLMSKETINQEEPWHSTRCGAHRSHLTNMIECATSMPFCAKLLWSHIITRTAYAVSVLKRFRVRLSIRLSPGHTL